MEDFISNYKVYEDGRVQRVVLNPEMGKSYIGRFLKEDIGKKGYVRVTLCNNGIARKFLVHRLVATLYIPNPESLPEVNHKDGNTRNNCVENLEWVSKSSNRRHALDILKCNVCKGEDRPEAKLTEALVRLIRSDVNSEGFNITQTAKLLGVSRTAVQDVVHNRTWKHVI